MTPARPSLRLKLNVFESTSPIQSAGSVSLLIGKLDITNAYHAVKRERRALDPF